jgi:hypothetical protein
MLRTYVTQKTASGKNQTAKIPGNICKRPPIGGASVVFKFNITNLWTKVITVDRAETSCGCTLARQSVRQPGPAGET